MKPNIQWLRHIIRLLVFALLFAIPCLMHYRLVLKNHGVEEVRAKEQKGFGDHVILWLDAGFRGESEADFEHATENRATTLDTLKKIRGNTWSAEVAGVSMSDPLGGVESAAASRSVNRTLLVGMFIPVVVTVLFGRFFCSWICPAGFLFELADKLRSGLHRLHAVHHLNLWRGNKYVFLIIGLGLSALMGIPLLGHLYPPALVARESQQLMSGLLLGSGITITTTSLLVLGILLFEIFVSRRAWCRHLCPGGALYSLLGSRRLARIHNHTDICTQCTDCIPACPMGLNPMKNKFGPECDLCLECHSACESGSLKLRPAISDLDPIAETGDISPKNRE